jgi:hypothetical protein
LSNNYVIYLNKIKQCIYFILAIPLRIKAIRENRTESLKHWKVQAIKMKQASENSFCPGEVGQSVTVKIPDVDRARSDFRNIIGVILSGTQKYFTYIINTPDKIIKMYLFCFYC